MTQKNDDGFDRLRFIGYCLAKLPPEEAEVDYDDFVRYAKFQLCRANRLSMKDPIWDTYKSEEILIEYYALVFHNNDKEADKFLSKLKGYDEDIYDWFDEQISKNQEELENQDDDQISFNPESIGD